MRYKASTSTCWPLNILIGQPVRPRHRVSGRIAVHLFEQAFNQEGKPMIKAVYDNLEGQDFWDATPVLLGIDAGGTRARRQVAAMLRAEAKA